VICSEEWRVNSFDYHAGTLSNYGSAFRVQVTAYLTGLLQLRGLRFGLLQDGDVGVGFFQFNASSPPHSDPLEPPFGRNACKMTPELSPRNDSVPDNNIGRLDVAMSDPFGAGSVQCIGDLNGEKQDQFGLQWLA
jgi:hypothetical protein